MKCNTIGSQLTPRKPCLGLGSETFQYVKNTLDRPNNILCQSPFDNSESVRSGPLRVLVKVGLGVVMGYSVCFYYRIRSILYLTYPNDVVGRFANSRVSQALFGLFGLALTRRRVLELGDLSSGHNLGQVKANLRDSSEEQAVLVTLANCLEENELLEYPPWCNN